MGNSVEDWLAQRKKIIDEGIAGKVPSVPPPSSSTDPNNKLGKTGGDIHASLPDPNSDDPNSPANAPAGHQAQAAYDQWNQQAPGFVATQVGGAQDAARRALAEEIQQNKTSANSRGLLYSGQEAGAEAQSKADVGSKLASNIYDINSKAQDITAQKNNLAQQEARGEDANTLAMQQLQVDASQSDYQLAIEQMKSQNNYYGSLASGGAQVAGMVLAAIL